jgi:hypothetical protein
LTHEDLELECTSALEKGGIVRTVKVLTFEGCPNHRPTVELIHDVARELRIDVEVHEVEVSDPEDATRLRFLGSPTVQVDGADIEPGRRQDSGYGMSCRMYGVSGIPPRALVVSALTDVPL